MAERRAMIIEDSPTMRQLISFALRRIPGLASVEALNGADALERLENESVDVILLDLNMPVMNGFAFLERLVDGTTNPPPVIVVTTEGGEDDVQRAMELGAVAYVTKPVQAANLAATVEKVLSEHPRNAAPDVSD